jgi:hypothetical protein
VVWNTRIYSVATGLETRCLSLGSLPIFFRAYTDDQWKYLLLVQILLCLIVLLLITVGGGLRQDPKRCESSLHTRQNPPPIIHSLYVKL